MHRAVDDYGGRILSASRSVQAPEFTLPTEERRSAGECWLGADGGDLLPRGCDRTVQLELELYRTRCRDHCDGAPLWPFAEPSHSGSSSPTHLTFAS